MTAATVCAVTIEGSSRASATDTFTKSILSQSVLSMMKSHFVFIASKDKLRPNWSNKHLLNTSVNDLKFTWTPNDITNPKMAAPNSGIFWLHFHAVVRSGQTSSILICSLWSNCSFSREVSVSLFVRVFNVKVQSLCVSIPVTSSSTHSLFSAHSLSLFPASLVVLKALWGCLIAPPGLVHWALLQKKQCELSFVYSATI